jgi:predicted DNA-binding transcriptional regulator AlpA
MLQDLLDERLEAMAERILQQLLEIVRHQQPEQATEEHMITERELAAMLHCDPRTVRRLEQGGMLPAAVRFGGSKRWRLHEVSAWIEGLRDPNTMQRRQR